MNECTMYAQPTMLILAILFAALDCFIDKLKALWSTIGRTQLNLL